MSPAYSPKEAVPLNTFSFAPPLYNITLDNYSVSDRLSQVAGSAEQPCRSRAFPQAEGAMSVEPTVTAGTSLRGQVCTPSQRITDSVLQQTFFGNQGMHYMASQSTVDENIEDLFHYSHLELQEQM